MTRVRKEDLDQVMPELVRLYRDEGHSIRQIAKLYNASYGCIHRRLSESGVKMRKRGWEGVHQQAELTKQREERALEDEEL